MDSKQLWETGDHLALVDHPLYGTVVAAAGYGARFLSFDNDIRMYFSKENPQLQALEALENTYSKDENVLFTLAPQSQNVFSRESLAAVAEVTEASWQIPYSTLSGRECYVCERYPVDRKYSGYNGIVDRVEL